MTKEKETVVTEFFRQDYEKSINEKMLYYDYAFPEQEVISYIRGIIATDCSLFVNFSLQTLITENLNAAHVFQFSNVDDGTYRLCNILKSIEDPGVNYLQAGKLLLSDGKERLVAAYRKYGENHTKTAASLGLLHELDKIYFLTCLGKTADLLSEEERAKLMVRLILRNTLVIKILQTAKKRRFSLRNLLCFLSDSTYKRRKSNICTIIKKLQKSDEFDFSPFLENIEF